MSSVFSGNCERVHNRNDYDFRNSALVKAGNTASSLLKTSGKYNRRAVSGKSAKLGPVIKLDNRYCLLFGHTDLTDGLLSVNQVQSHCVLDRIKADMDPGIRPFIVFGLRGPAGTLSILLGFLPRGKSHAAPIHIHLGGSVSNLMILYGLQECRSL